MARETYKSRLADIASAAGELRGSVESLRDDLQGWLDSMPDSVRDGMKGNAVETVIDMLDTLNAELGEAEGAEAEW